MQDGGFSNLNHSFFLGEDVPDLELQQLMIHYSGTEDIKTRAQAKKYVKDEIIMREQDVLSRAKSKPSGGTWTV